MKLNLVQPKQRRPVAGRADEAVAVHLAKGGVGQVPHEKVPLDYEHIFSFSPPAGISRKRVLIEGVPGSGKSTLVQRMCHDWSVGRFAQEYKVVIQVTLRNLPKDQKLTLEDLIFTSVGDADIVQEVTKFIIKHHGQEVLFIFDGFDELPEELREKSPVRDIVAGHLAPQSSFIVTTRPISAESLYHKVDRRVEISGFGDEEVEKFVTEYYASSNPSTGEKLLLTLSLHPHIKNLCYVPLLLLLICYVTSLSGDTPELLLTQHQLFVYLIVNTINHNLKRAGWKERVSSLQDVMQLCPSFNRLTELALEGIEKDTIIFSDLDFEVDGAFLGLFNCIEAQNRFGIISRTWHFLHLTLQEFMAAIAVTKKAPDEQVTFWKQHLILKYNKRGIFDLADDRNRSMFLFYCGLSGLSTPGMQAMLLDRLRTVVEPSIGLYTPLPELCNIVAESGNEQLARSIVSTCGPTVEISGNCLKDAGVTWCMTQHCKQVEGTGIRIEGDVYSSTIASFFSQMGDVSKLTKVELLNCQVDDGKLLQGQLNPFMAADILLDCRELRLRHLIIRIISGGWLEHICYVVHFLQLSKNSKLQMVHNRSCNIRGNTRIHVIGVPVASALMS